MARVTLAERFEAKVDRSAGPDGCHLWQGAVQSAGYGAIYVSGRVQLAHRVAWELVHGAIPAGHQIDHVAELGCGSLLCVNVAHLEPVTLLENVRRQHEAGRVNTEVMIAVAARLKRERTHCRRGHPFSPENTRVERGGRHCRTCDRENRHARSS